MNSRASKQAAKALTQTQKQAATDASQETTKI